MKKLFVILLMLVMSGLYAQDKEITWQKERRLTWEDFQGPPKMDQDYAAQTYSGISYGFNATVTNGEVVVQYEVNCYFVLNKSWVKPQYADNYLLGHEQLHFDITELMTRKLRKRFSEKKFTENVKKEMRAIYETVNKERVEMQRKYDEETEHSKIEDKQKEWEVFVVQELQKLSEFASK